MNTVLAFSPCIPTPVMPRGPGRPGAPKSPYRSKVRAEVNDKQPHVDVDGTCITLIFSDLLHVESTHLCSVPT